MLIVIGLVAQLVEQTPLKRTVPGSNPGRPIKKVLTFTVRTFFMV